jgi:hypothetical protein
MAKDIIKALAPSIPRKEAWRRELSLSSLNP